METTEHIGWRWLVAVFAITFVVYALSPVRQNFDSYLAFPTAQSALHDGNLTLNEFDTPKFETHGWISTTENGNEFNTYPWVPSLMLIPSVIVLDVAHAVGIGPGSYVVANGGRMDTIQQLNASALMALVAVIVFAIAFQRLRPTLSLKRRRLTASVVTFGFAFGTAAWSTASRAMWQHGPSLLFLAIAVYCGQRLLRDPEAEGPGLNWTAVGLGAAVAASFTCRPTNALAVLGFTAFVVLCLRKYVRRFLVGALAVAMPWTLVNITAFGELLPDYYKAGKLQLHDEYGRALATNLVSPARGLLLFSPIVVLGVFGLAKRNRDAARDGLIAFDRMLLGLALAYLLASSGPPENWWGGHSFGPRFMSDTLVFFAAAATPTVAMLMPRASTGRASTGVGVVRRRLAPATAIALLAWSVLINAQGGAMRSTLCWNGEPNIDANTARLWDFERSQMLSGVQAIADDGIVDAIFTRCTD